MLFCGLPKFNVQQVWSIYLFIYLFGMWKIPMEFALCKIAQLTNGRP